MKHRYYNAGVMLINCKSWRDEGLDLKMLEWASQNAKAIRYADQDAINFISDGRIKTLDPKYNTFGYAFNEMTDGDRPVIIHYVRSLKPWNPLSRLPAESEYFRYLKLTKWNQGKYQRFIKTLILLGSHWLGEGLKKILRVVSPTLFRQLKRLYLKGRNK
jgi:lipopolysaccharide biosynthesis glycosyltransferase